MAPEARRHNRVVTFVTDAEFAVLEPLTNEQQLPLSSVVREILRPLPRRR